MVCKRRGEEDNKYNTAFKEWSEKNQSRFATVETKNCMNSCYIYNTQELVRASLMQLRACFSLVEKDSNSAERQKIAAFFNMEYSEWVRLLIKEHSVHPESVDPSQLNALLGSVLEIERGVVDAVGTVHAMQVNVLESNFGRKAQQLDMYYSNLVHGAAIKVPLGEIWCPSNELEHSDRDTDKFFEVMWKNLKQMLKNIMSSSTAVNSRGMVEYTNNLIKSIKSVRDIKRYMKEIWEESKMYRISDRVHMVEVQLLQRLRADGVFEWFDNEGLLASSSSSKGDKSRAQNLHVCFFMRRFACCTDARMCVCVFMCVCVCIFTQGLEGFMKAKRAPKDSHVLIQ
jgi:hypothetical protein